MRTAKSPRKVQTLAQSLAALRASVVAKLPSGVMSDIERQIVELRATGIMGRALGVGDRIPPFVLENQHGAPISSQVLLDSGPLVINFYRGKW